MNEDLKDRLWLILITGVILILFFLGIFYAFGLEVLPNSTLNANGNDLIMVQENSLKATISPIYIPEIEYQELINCLITYESQGNEFATGDSGLAYGILQFHKETFDKYSTEYGMKLDYKNPKDQILLADYMLKENIDNIKHWSVWKKCYNK